MLQTPFGVKLPNLICHHCNWNLFRSTFREIENSYQSTWRTSKKWASWIISQYSWWHRRRIPVFISMKTFLLTIFHFHRNTPIWKYSQCQNIVCECRYTQNSNKIESTNRKIQIYISLYEALTHCTWITKMSFASMASFTSLIAKQQNLSGFRRIKNCWLIDTMPEFKFTTKEFIGLFSLNFSCRISWKIWTLL